MFTIFKCFYLNNHKILHEKNSSKVVKFIWKMHNVLKRLANQFSDFNFLSYRLFCTKNSSKTWPILSTKTTISQKLNIAQKNSRVSQLRICRLGWINFQLFYEIVSVLVAKVAYPCELKFTKIFLIWVDIFMKRITSKLSNFSIKNATLRIRAHS